MIQLPQEKIDAIQNDLAVVLQEGKTIVVRSSKDQESASLYLGKVKQRISRLESLRKEFVAPMNESVKAINNRFKSFTEPLEDIEAKIKEALVNFIREEQKKADEEFQRQLEIQRKAEEEQRQKALEADLLRLAAEKAIALAKTKKAREEASRLEEEAKKQATEAEQMSLTIPVAIVEEPKKTIRTEAGTVSAKRIWTWKIVEPHKVPAQYLVINEKEINRAVNSGVRNIEGIMIYEDFEMASRKI